jgi:AraC-like DNA-binding protein
MVQPLQQSAPGQGPSWTGTKRCILFSSDLYSISDFESLTGSRTGFGKGHTSEFCINFPRQGYYVYQSFRRRHEEYSSQVLIEKPGCGFSLVQQWPGQGACTIFRFNDAAYETIKEQYRLNDCSFFTNPDIFSLLLKASPEAEYFHHRILQQVQGAEASKLETDQLVMEMVDAVMQALMITPCKAVPENHREHHLVTIERAKEYLFQEFHRDISLLELARHCYVSVFHFSRLFKQFTGHSPYHYLRKIRLQHAERLIRTTDLPVTDVCFQSGFNRLDYFSTAFAKRYNVPPSKYK